MGAIAAAGNDHAVRFLFSMTFLYVLQGVRETGQIDNFGCVYVRPSAMPCGPVRPYPNIAFIVPPQVQANTPTRGGSSLTSRSGGSH